MLKIKSITNNLFNIIFWSMLLLGQTVYAQTPFISVKQNTVLIPTSTGSHNFGNINVDSNSNIINFTVENNGTAPLNLSNFQITGTNASMFLTTNFITTTINGGANTTFGLQFNPTSTGTKTAFVSIGNNVFYNSIPNSFTNKTTANGLGNNVVNDVFVSGITLYMGTNGGLSISTDGGNTFSNKTDFHGLGVGSVNNVYVSGGVIYAATTNGLSFSTNGGTSFTNKTMTNGLGENQVMDVYVSGGVVYATSFNGFSGLGGVAFSTDGGNTFTNKTTANGLGHNQVNNVFVNGMTVYASTINGFSISADGGNTFTNKTNANGLGHNYTYCSTINGGIIYVGTAGGLSISTDGGNTFTNKTTANGLGDNNIRAIYINNGVIYAATDNGLSISLDGGNTFTNKTNANSSLGNNVVRSVYVSGTTIYAATFGGGLSIGSMPTVPYTFTVTGTGAEPFISVKQNTVLIPTSTGSYNFGNINVGANSGMIQFTVENSGTAPLNLSNFQITGVSASMFTTTNFITTTINGGANTTFGLQFNPTSPGTKTAFVSIGNNVFYNPVPNSFTNKTTTNGLGNNTVRSVYVHGGIIYVATLGGLSISTDGGNSFINKTTANGLGNNQVWGVYVSGNTIYAATFGGGLSISTDGGNSFINKTTTNGLGSNFLENVYVSGGTIYAATFGGGLSISTDGGNSFTNKTTVNGLGNNEIRGVYVSNGIIYVATFGGLSFSTDGGNTFTNKTTANGLGNNSIGSVYVSNGIIYAATDGGLSFSTDGGSFFTNKTTTNGLGSSLAYSVFVKEGTIYVGTSSGLSISTNGGASFINKTNANSSLGNNQVRVGYVNGGVVYAATANGLSISNSNTNPYTFTVTGTGLGSLISVKQQAINTILNNVGLYDFGNVNVNANSGDITFTIENNGNLPLNLGTIQINGIDANLFTSTAVASQTVNAGGNTTFTVKFSPTSSGLKTAFVTIANNSSANPYTFTLYGIGTVQAPFISVKQNLTLLPTSTGTYNFGNVNIGSNSGDVTFTIENNGATALNLNSIQINGNDADQFTGTPVASQTVNGAGNTTFTAKFNPSSEGTKTAVLMINNNTLYNSIPSSFNNRTTAQGLGFDVATSLYIYNGIIYASTYNGLSFSTDGGNTFVNKTTVNGLGNNSTNGVYVIGKNVYVATNSGLSFSTDGGNTFINKTTANGLGSNIVNNVYVSGGCIYAATNSGLSFSTDGGNTFSNKNTANTPTLGSNQVHDLYIAGSTIYVALYDFTFGGVAISTDGGNTFSKKNTANGLGHNGVRDVYVHNGVIYAATFGGLSFSTDGGNTFVNKTTAHGLGNNEVRGLHIHGETIYAATLGGLSFSTNGGVSFTNKTTANGLGNNDLRDVYSDGKITCTATFGGLSIAKPEPYIFTITGTGVAPFISVKQGTSSIPHSTGSYDFGNTIVNSNSGDINFTIENTGLGTLSLGAIQINGADANQFTSTVVASQTVSGGANTTFTAKFSPTSVGIKTAFVTIENNGLYNAIPNSFANKTTTNGLGDNTVFGVHTYRGTIYAATLAGLSISTDGGNTFTNKTTANGLGNNAVYNVYVYNEVIYAATNGGLSFSTDGGNTFVNKTTTNGLGTNPIVNVYANGGRVYAATTSGLSISTNDGLSFFNRTTANGLGNNQVKSMYVSNDILYVSTALGLSFSTDGGNTFVNKTTANGLGNNGVLGTYAYKGTIYAATGGGLSFSTDGGNTFVNKTTANGLGNNTVHRVFVNEAAIYAATSGGLSFSTDGGNTFANKTTANGLGNDWNGGLHIDGRMVYAATNGGLSIGAITPIPYTFTLKGTGTAAPIFNIKQGTNIIANNIGNYNFGNINVGSNSGDITFTIENTGIEPLNLTSFQINGANATEFSTTNFVTTTINASGNTTFTIKFTPTSAGVKTAFVTIGNNSATNPYTFTITGAGQTVTVTPTPTPNPISTPNTPVVVIPVTITTMIAGQNVTLRTDKTIEITGEFEIGKNILINLPLQNILPQGSVGFTNGLLIPYILGEQEITLIDRNGNAFKIKLKVVKQKPQIQASQFGTLSDRVWNEPAFSPLFGLPNVDFEILSGGATKTTDNKILLQKFVGFITMKVWIPESANSEKSNEIILNFKVNKATQTLTFETNNLVNKTFGDPDFGLQATASSSLPITYEILEGKDVISVSNGTVKILKAGFVRIRAAQNGGEFYHAAEGKEVSFVISKKAQTINFNQISNIAFSNNPNADGVTVLATASSGLPVQISVSPADMADVQENRIIPKKAGYFTLTLQQNGNDQFSAAPAVYQYQIAVRPTLLISNVSLSADGEILTLDYQAIGSNQISFYLINTQTSPQVFEYLGSQTHLSGKFTVEMPANTPQSNKYEVKIVSESPVRAESALKAVPPMVYPKPVQPFLRQVGSQVCVETQGLTDFKIDWYINGKFFRTTINQNCIEIATFFGQGGRIENEIAEVYAVIQSGTRRSPVSTAIKVENPKIVTATQNNEWAKDLMVYPNPSNGEFRVQLDQKFERMTWQIFDAQGKRIREKTYRNLFGINELINLEKVSSGVYYLRIETEKGSFSKKITVE